MSWDVTGLGNALMDALVVIDDDALLEELGIVRGMMHPVDHDAWYRVYNHFPESEITLESGGSCANTLAAVARLGGNAMYCGQVGNDALGEVYTERLMETMGHHALRVADGPTGKCLSIISRSDAERTLVTDLGTAISLAQLGAFEAHLSRTKIAHFTGYTLLSEPTRSVTLAAMRIAHESGAIVSLDVADPFVIQGIRDVLADAIDRYTDIVFLNAEEARALTGQDPETAAEYLSREAKVRTVIVKHGAKGSTIVEDGRTYDVAADKVRALDTTGAGDAYAGGYLYGVSRGWEPARCGELGSAIAALVVSQVGAVLKPSEQLTSTLARFGMAPA